MEDGCADLVTAHVHIELEALSESLCFTGVLMPGNQSSAKLCRLCPAKSKKIVKHGNALKTLSLHWDSAYAMA